MSHVTMLCIAVLHMVNCGMCTADSTHVLLVIIFSTGVFLLQFEKLAQ